MQYNEFSSLFHQSLYPNKLDYLESKELDSKFYQLTKHMLAVNSVMNLTAITDVRELILRHYIDSLTLLAHIPHGVSVIDVGCGAGFPSLPLALARPDLRITALDSTEKKVRYVAETARLLEIPSCRFTTIYGRAEELAAAEMPLRESFDVVVSRAVARLNILDELCIPFLKVNGTFLAMKGMRAAEELSEVENGIRQLGACSVTMLDSPIFPPCENDTSSFFAEHHTLIIVKKGGKTPKSFPRKYAQILKKPL